MPVLARVYHITPREQATLTLAEFHRLQQDYEQLRRAQEEA